MNYYRFDSCNRVHLFDSETLDRYYKNNVLPNKGTTYGEVELLMYREMRLANKIGAELIGIPGGITGYTLNDNPANKDS